MAHVNRGARDATMLVALPARLDAAYAPGFDRAMAALTRSLGSRAVDYVSRRLRFPWAFAAFALLLALDLALPDAIPFLDEAILAIGTALFAAWKKRRGIVERPPLERGARQDE